jgi:hypothetical protein
MGALERGKAYVGRLATAREKAAYLVRLGFPQEAREVAVLANDAGLLESIARNEL